MGVSWGGEFRIGYWAGWDSLCRRQYQQPCALFSLRHRNPQHNAYGDTDPYTSGGINAIHTFQDMCRYLRGNVVGIVYGSASNLGDVQKQPELMERAYELGKKAGTAA